MTRFSRAATRLSRCALLLTLATAGFACNGPTGPTSPPASAPVITCPASQAVAAPTSGGVAVSYAAPTVTGGTAPVGAPVCTPPSGSSFNVGTTVVNCTVRDADQRTASCSFNVTVTPPPVLQRTSFMAFGDSMTEGSLSLCFVQAPGFRAPSFREDAAMIRAAVNVPFSYPSQLQTLLTQRYLLQSPTVVNEGRGGETVLETEFTGEGGLTGHDRFPFALLNHQPSVLLLMHGINDIHQGITPAELVEGLRDMVRYARSRDVIVYLGTLLPQRPGGCRNYALASDIQEANDRIKVMGIVEGARLVDLHAAIAGKEDTLLGPDGLHPNEAGYKVMADTFLAAIKSNLEVYPAPNSAVRSDGR